MARGHSNGPGADVSRADAAGAGALARGVAGAAGLAHSPGGRRAGARPAHGGRLAGRRPPRRPRGADLCAHRRLPPALNQEQQAALKAAVQRPPREAGSEQAGWHGKVVRRFVQERFGITLGRSSCLTYLHRLGFVRKRPKKLLLQANEAKREAFVAAYATARRAAQARGAKILFVDEAHFYADVDLHSLGVLKGTPALGPSTCTAWGSSKAPRRWGRPPARAMARRPATTRRSVWRPARWTPCRWRATAAPRRRSPSFSTCGRATRRS